MTDSRYDLIVVGGGIVGLAHAWAGSRRGLNVLVLERSPQARGASVRNFGMIWPIGQPEGAAYSTALRSRGLWLELAAAGVLPIEECGSLHLAHHPDELDVLEEFCGRKTHDCRMLTSAETCAMSSLANPTGLLGAMHSPTELRVNPRIASARIAGWLNDQPSVDVRFQTTVVSVDSVDSNADGVTVRAGDGTSWRTNQTIICSGSDLQTLFPDEYAGSGLRLCKLQMLKSSPQTGLKPNEPHIASGLTLRHYTSFEDCRSLQTLKQRIASETPELNRFGIHVMASAFPDGSVILGDSHEYDADIQPFQKSEIDDLMLRELRKVIQLSDWTITERWHGIYAKNSAGPFFESSPQPGVKTFTGTGGAGMTMSFGLADEAWQRWSDKS